MGSRLSSERRRLSDNAPSLAVAVTRKRTLLRALPSSSDPSSCAGDQLAGVDDSRGAILFSEELLILELRLATSAELAWR